jgi:NtrC-family two-component system sensor histidine kinase KinB
MHPVGAEVNVMIGIRHKLTLAFVGLFSIVAAIGVLTIANINDLGDAIDVILRENYRSVVACQEMEESLERIDSAALFSFAGKADEGRKIVDENIQRFEQNLAVELGNITLPGEGEKAQRIQNVFALYRKTIPKVTDTSLPLDARRATYFGKTLPLFLEAKGLAQQILEMNQANMSDANDAARRRAASAHRQMIIAIMLCGAVAVPSSVMAHRWILKPIHRLIETADEIRRGNLDVVVGADSRDEIGQLSGAFNSMTEALRRARRNEQMDLARTRRATEEVFKSLPAAVAVLDLNGRVEIATETAAKHFGLKPGANVKDLKFSWLTELVRRSIDKDDAVEVREANGYVQQFIENREYFFQPTAVPIRTEQRRGDRTGTAIILKDVTKVNEQQELKKNVVSTVSHQLKTPLTSLRMSIHLLLEEKVGPLNPKQTDLLVAARDESERLSHILDDLLDLNRIESDGSLLSIQTVQPNSLVRDALAPFLVESKDRGIAIVTSVPDDLPDVLADPVRIGDVFANLLSNAIRFTKPGGSIAIGAEASGDTVRFAVTDTGPGIPKENVDQVFEPFYRVPGQGGEKGVGLGLAIVKQIVTAHKGEVGVRSSIGEGSSFWFTLPCAKTGEK